VDHPTIQAGTTPGVSAAEKRAPAASAVALGALLFCSASLNVAQFARAAAGADSSASALGQGYAPRVQPPLGNGNCAAGTVHACVQAGPGAAGLGMAPVPAAATAGAAAADSVAAVAAADADGVDSFVEAGTVPGRNAQTAASGGARYCRKDTWLLSCLFYKADINDELTDWRSVKAECGPRAAVRRCQQVLDLGPVAHLQQRRGARVRRELDGRVRHGRQRVLQGGKPGVERVHRGQLVPRGGRVGEPVAVK
jgi:hypothetical protein